MISEICKTYTKKFTDIEQGFTFIFMFFESFSTNII
jgi:hypothetical protein